MTPLLAPLRRFKRHLREWDEDRRIAGFERRASALAERPRRSSRAVVLPAAGVGSLGDEAMLLASGQVMRRHGVERLTILSYGPAEAWDAVGEFDDVVSLGMRYSRDFWGTCEQFLDLCESATHCLIQGADVMDGYYSPYECLRRTAYARIAAAAGVRTAIGGFSFNDTPHRRSVAALAALPETVRLVARDPVSWARLDEHVARRVHHGADMAFLLEPARRAPAVADLADWLDEQRRDGRLLIGVNANYLVAPRHREDDDGSWLIDAYADALAPLMTGPERASLVLVPHDYRRMAGRWDDRELLRAIAGRFPDEVAGRVRLVESRLAADEAKSLVGRLDLVVSGRMHLAIAALDQGVPAVGIAYQGKFEGLYRHVGVRGMVVSPAGLAAGELGPRLQDAAGRRAELSETIGEHLPRVRKLAMESFGNLIAGAHAGGAR